MKVLLIAAHPVQYASPLFRRYAAHEDLDVTVAYLSMRGVEPSLDPDFGRPVVWDVPLLDGYRWLHVRNVSPADHSHRLLGMINPGIALLIRREKFDIVVSYGHRTLTAWIAWAAARYAGARLVFTTDAHVIRPQHGRSWKAPTKRAVFPRMYRLVDAVFAMGSAGRRFLTDELDVPPNKVFLTPFVVDNAFFATRATAEERSRVRRRWSASDRLVALFVGKLSSWKRPHDLVEAVAKTSNVVGAFVGAGPLRSALENRARELGIQDRMRFEGFVNQSKLPAIYAASDVLVLPSEYEAFGLVVNEAFASGRSAIVSEACGCARDLVQHGQTGFVVPVGDTASIARRLEALDADRDLLRHLSEQAVSRIGAWDLEANVDAFVQACRELVQGAPR